MRNIRASGHAHHLVGDCATEVHYYACQSEEKALLLAGSDHGKHTAVRCCDLIVAGSVLAFERREVGKDAGPDKVVETREEADG